MAGFVRKRKNSRNAFQTGAKIHFSEKNILGSHNITNITNAVRESPPPDKLAVLSSQTHPLATKNFQNRCFRFLLRLEDVPREIENNATAKFGGWGEGGGRGIEQVHYGICKS